MQRNAELQKLVGEFLTALKIHLGINLKAYTAGGNVSFYEVEPDCIYEVARLNRALVTSSDAYGLQCTVETPAGHLTLHEKPHVTEQAVNMLREGMLAGNEGLPDGVLARESFTNA